MTCWRLSIARHRCCLAQRHQQQHCGCWIIHSVTSWCWPPVHSLEVAQAFMTSSSYTSPSSSFSPSMPPSSLRSLVPVIIHWLTVRRAITDSLTHSLTHCLMQRQCDFIKPFFTYAWMVCLIILTLQTESVVWMQIHCEPIKGWGLGKQWTKY